MSLGDAGASKCSFSVGEHHTSSAGIHAEARQSMKLHGPLSDHEKSAIMASAERLSLQSDVKMRNNSIINNDKKQKLASNILIETSGNSCNRLKDSFVEFLEIL